MLEKFQSQDLVNTMKKIFIKSFVDEQMSFYICGESHTVQQAEYTFFHKKNTFFPEAQFS